MTDDKPMISSEIGDYARAGDNVFGRGENSPWK